MADPVLNSQPEVEMQADEDSEEAPHSGTFQSWSEAREHFDSLNLADALLFYE